MPLKSQPCIPSLRPCASQVITKTLSFKEAFGAFTNEVIWLIVLAVFFSRGFVSSGLGNRVATFFVSKFGGSSLGLGYGLALSEALIAPAMPSTTARASIYVPPRGQTRRPDSRRAGAFAHGPSGLRAELRSFGPPQCTPPSPSEVPAKSAPSDSPPIPLRFHSDRPPIKQRVRRSRCLS